MTHPLANCTYEKGFGNANPLFKDAFPLWQNLETPNPVTVFSGQPVGMGTPAADYVAAVMSWTDKPDGIEVSTWGDMIDLDRAATDPDYVRQLNASYGGIWALSDHLVTELIFQFPIDRTSFEGIASDLFEGIESEEWLTPAECETVRKRAIAHLKKVVDAAAHMKKVLGHDVVINGFTGCSIMHLIHNFPNNQKAVEKAFAAWGKIWREDILPYFEEKGVCFALEIHPGEMAFDFWSAVKCLEAVEYHPNFGFNLDPSHPAWMGSNPAAMAAALGDRVFHVHGKGITRNAHDGLASCLGGWLDFGDNRRGWSFEANGLGCVEVMTFVGTLKAIGYRGPLSGEWESCRNDWSEAQPMMVTVLKTARDTKGASGSFDTFDN